MKSGEQTDQAGQPESVAVPMGKPEPPLYAFDLNPLKLSDPFRWLAAGARDFGRAPLVGLFFGACFVTMGWALFVAFQHAPAFVLALSAGFLLVGPFFCMGLYQVSDRLSRGEKPDLEDAITAWDGNFGTLAIFGVVLLVMEMLWARASLVVFAIAIPGPMPDFSGSLSSVLDPANFDFVLAWLGLGGIFATIVYSLCAVSIPMIMDKKVDSISAGLTSMRLVLEQPVVMLFWAFLIAVLVFAAMLPGFAGLFIVAPIVGHASWHAYKAAVVVRLRPRLGD